MSVTFGGMDAAVTNAYEVLPKAKLQGSKPAGTLVLNPTPTIPKGDGFCTPISRMTRNSLLCYEETLQYHPKNHFLQDTFVRRVVKKT